MYNNFRAISKLLWAQTQANPQKRDPYLNKKKQTSHSVWWKGKKERQWGRRTVSKGEGERINVGPQTLTSTQIKEGERAVKERAEITALVPFPLSPLIITHPSSKPASRLSSPCLCLRLSLSSNSPPAPCWIRLKAEVVSIAALPTWFGSSAWATVPGYKLMGSFGQAGHREVSDCYATAVHFLKKRMTTHEA